MTLIIGSRSSNLLVPMVQTSPELAGTIVPFAGDVSGFTQMSTDGTTLYYLNGWALCNGASISQLVYSNLYARLGNLYNTQINPTTNVTYATPTAGNFRIPDYTGTFLRGVGTPNGLNTVTLGGYQSQTTAVNGVSASTGNLAISSVSSGAAGAHTHAVRAQRNYTGHLPCGYGGSYGFSWAIVGTPEQLDPFIWTLDTNGNSIAGTDQMSPHTHDISHTHPSPSIFVTSPSNETRPINKGVNWLIRMYDAPTADVSSYITSVPPRYTTVLTGSTSLLIDTYYTCNSASATTQTLPSATGTNHCITIENTGTGLLTVVASLSQSINGVNSQVLGQYSSITVRDYAAGSWIIMY